MDDQWKDETCGTCYFNIDKKCRRTPPSFEDFKTCCSDTGIGIPLERKYPSFDYCLVDEKTLACYYWRENSTSSSRLPILLSDPG